MKFLLFAFLAVAASASFAPLYKAQERIDGSYFVVLHDEESLSAALSNIGSSPFFSILGGRIDRVYGTVLNGFSATLSDKALEFIRSMDIVKYVEEVGIARISNVASWGLDRIDQRNLPLDDQYNPSYSGETEVHVYVIDTGIFTHHVDFEGRATFDIEYSNKRAGNEYQDCNGHGTHCAGTVGGAYYGVAPGTRLHGIGVLNCIGSGSFADIISGMNYVAGDNDNRPAVASMSLGGGSSMAVDEAVESLTNAGVTTVVAAGNSDADACNTSPAGAPAAYCVGATDINDVRASYSNYGSCVNIFAPGSSITSAWIGSDTDANTISGTSMACPHVAGAAALILEQNGGFSVQQVKDELTANATPGLVQDPGQSSLNLLLYVGTPEEES